MVEALRCVLEESQRAVLAVLAADAEAAVVAAAAVVVAVVAAVVGSLVDLEEAVVVASCRLAYERQLEPGLELEPELGPEPEPGPVAGVP